MSKRTKMVIYNQVDSIFPDGLTDSNYNINQVGPKVFWVTPRNSASKVLS